MCQLLETVRIENFVPENLKFHQQRMDYAARKLWNNTAPDLAKFIEYQVLPGPGVYKCRICYDQKQIMADFQKYTIRSVRSLKLIQADSLDYGFKYADRSSIEALFGQRGQADDVLFLRNGLITDTSYANVALLKDNQWYTPAKPLLNGTMRQFLLESGILKETDISSDQIMEFSTIRLINAMMPWGKGAEVQCADVQMC